MPTLETPRPSDLHAQVRALTALVRDRRGLSLGADGLLAPAEARTVAALFGHGVTQAETVRGLAEHVGLLRRRGNRLETAPLSQAWNKLAVPVRCSLLYAATFARRAARTPGDTLQGRFLAHRVAVLSALRDHISLHTSLYISLRDREERRAFASCTVALHPLLDAGCRALVAAERTRPVKGSALGTPPDRREPTMSRDKRSGEWLGGEGSDDANSREGPGGGRGATRARDTVMELFLQPLVDLDLARLGRLEPTSEKPKPDDAHSSYAASVQLYDAVSLTPGALVAIATAILADEEGTKREWAV